MSPSVLEATSLRSSQVVVFVLSCLKAGLFLHRSALDVLPNHVVDTADRWTPDGRVVPVMVIHVEPVVKGTGPSRL